MKILSIRVAEFVEIRVRRDISGINALLYRISINSPLGICVSEFNRLISKQSYFPVVFGPEHWLIHH